MRIWRTGTNWGCTWDSRRNSAMTCLGYSVLIFARRALIIQNITSLWRHSSPPPTRLNVSVSHSSPSHHHISPLHVLHHNSCYLKPALLIFGYLLLSCLFLLEIELHKSRNVSVWFCWKHAWQRAGVNSCMIE